MLRRVVILFLLSTIFLAACRMVKTTPAPTPLPTAPNAPTQARMGQPVELRIGEKASFANEKLWLMVAAVLEDSRCPKNVLCVQAGQVRLGLKVAKDDGPTTTVEIGSMPSNDTATFEIYQIKLLAVAPYPMTPEHEIGPQDYTITLLVSPQ